MEGFNIDTSFVDWADREKFNIRSLVGYSGIDWLIYWYSQAHIYELWRTPKHLKYLKDKP